MRLLRVEIERFRGIMSLDWFVNGEFVCLIGPGDSTKTTILDAIELALSPRWSIPFDDTDFYEANTSKPFTITVTVGDLPVELKSLHKFGDHTRGWLAPATLHDEPKEGDEVVLSIRLTVTSSLEPTWAVVNSREPDGVRISAEDREKLGCTRLGEFLDRHFSWARGSVVTQLTGKGKSIAGVLADATRAARGAVALAPAELRPFNEAAEVAQRLGSELGVQPRATYQARLDTSGVSLGAGGLSLHDGEVPFRRAGAGTRRLLAVAIQRELAKSGGLTLIDEVEHGLEPHRLRHLLRELRDGQGGKKGHVVMTTHAPVALAELDAGELRVVRCDGGVTRVQDVGQSLQPIVLKSAEAFLARKVLVCEGDTEVGLCRRLDLAWSANGASFALAGVAVTANGDGGRTVAPAAAKALADLQYDIAYLGDSDQRMQPGRASLQASGVSLFLWDDGVATELRVARDLPWAGVCDLVRIAMERRSQRSIRDSIADALAVKPAALSLDPNDWAAQVNDEPALREAIGAKAQDRDRGWFKGLEGGEQLADVILTHWEELAGKDLRVRLDELRAWAHGM